MGKYTINHLMILGISIAMFSGCTKEGPPKKAGSVPEHERVVKNESPDCIEFVALWSAGEVAEQLGKTKKWVFMNYTVDIWDDPNVEDTGSKVGALRASSYAPLISSMGEYYMVESPINGAQGWLHNSHVKTIVKKNPKTKALCE